MNSEEGVEGGSYFRLRLEGISMKPFLQDGDILTVKNVEISEIASGDMIAYWNLLSDRLVHRVIKKNIRNSKVTFLVKGDNQSCIGEYVYPEQILGKVIFVESQGRKVEIYNKCARIKTKFHTIFSEFEIFIYSFLKNIRYFLRHDILGGILRKLQGLKIYARLRGKTIEMDKIHYRTANINDMTSLAGFYRAYYWPVKLSTLNEIFNKSLSNFKDNGYYFLAQIGNKIIGSVVIRQFTNQEGILSGWWMYSFYMDWRYRKIGIEEQVIKLAIEEAKKGGANTIKILVPRRDIYSVNLFQSLYGEPILSRFDKRSIIFTWH